MPQRKFFQENTRSLQETLKRDSTGSPTAPAAWKSPNDRRSGVWQSMVTLQIDLPPVATQRSAQSDSRTPQPRDKGALRKVIPGRPTFAKPPIANFCVLA